MYQPLKKLLLVSAFSCLYVVTFSQSGIDIFKKMHKRYGGKWYRTFSFIQTTDFYRNDSLKRTDTWYEAASFPYDFRIDFKDPRAGNAVIYKEDSTYRFQNGKLSGVEGGTNPFTFLLGGMYAVSAENAIAKLTSQGYDLNKTYETDWSGSKAIVIGADRGDTVSKQFWVDKKDFYIVRTIEKDHDVLIDAHMLDHVQIKKGWSETKVEIFLNGKLRQVEKYRDLKGDLKLDKRLFEPSQFGKVFWQGK